MAELFNQLGVNVGQLVAQALNFAILLAVLSVFVYKPLLRAIEERRKKIEFGIKGAELAESKLAEADSVYHHKVKEGDKQAVQIIGRAEKEAAQRGAAIVSAAETKGDELLVLAKETIEKRKQKELEQLAQEAGGLIKAAIIKTVEVDPAMVDAALIERAVAALKKQA